MNTCSKCGVVYEGGEIFCPIDGTRLSGATTRHRRKSIPPKIDPMIGKVIQGRYRVIEHLGSGGMGVVYVAEHVEIEKKVALKVLRDDFTNRPEVVERFRQEARSASKIGHAHIVDVTDFGQIEDGGVYFTMEYLKGQSLSSMIQDKAVSFKIAVPIAIQIGQALQAAHNLGIIHRDLKPENIFLVERDGQKNFVKVLDFGIAKISDRDSEGKRLTQTGMIFGTPEYMSPEQASGKPMDHRVDIYALGCIMFEMFVGKVPFEGDTFMAVLTQHMFEPVPLIEERNPNADVPQSLKNIVYKTLAKEPGDRYSNMNELVDELQAAFNNADYVVENPKTKMDWSDSFHGVRAWASWKKKLYLVAVILVSATALVAAGFIFLGDRKQPDSLDWSAEPPVVRPTESSTDADKGSNSISKNIPSSQQDSAPMLESDTEKLGNSGSNVDAIKKNIAVSIQSKPTGAVISIEGMGQVCDKTPCDLEFEIGKPLVVSGKLGTKKAKMVFTPSSQNKQLILELKPQGESSKPTGRRTGNTKNHNTNDGLKIPDMFKEK